MIRRTIAALLLCLAACACGPSRRPDAAGRADGGNAAAPDNAETAGKNDENTPDETVAGASADRDTVIYLIPQCRLWYTAALPREYADKPAAMRTERETYWKGVRAVNVFVTNPSSEPLEFGREWRLLHREGGKWAPAEPKNPDAATVWNEDLFSVDGAPLFYCFRFDPSETYRLAEGEYRIAKTFLRGGETLELTAEFRIP